MSNEQCTKCGRLKAKTGEHLCPVSVWNKGKKGVQRAWNKGKPMSIASRTKLSATRQKNILSGEIAKPFGKKNGMYGKMPWNKENGFLSSQIRQLSEYRQWRSDVFTKDGFTCGGCGTKGGYLIAHHIKRFVDILTEYKIDSLDIARECSELWNINNGQTLCPKCHLDLHFHLKML